MLIQNRVQANEVTDDKSRIKQMENEIQELKRKLASQQSAGTGTVSPARERWRLAKMVGVDWCLLAFMPRLSLAQHVGPVARFDCFLHFDVQSVLAQKRRQKERWNVAMTAMKERTTIM